MRLSRQCWILETSLPARAAQAFGKALEGEAASVAVFAQPRKATAQVEAIFDAEPDRDRLNLKLAILASAFGVPAPAIALTPTPQLDWLKKVAADFPPLKIARWTVHGAKHRSSVPNRLYALQIDATSAFGTGEHPTTKGCLLMLDRFLNEGRCADRVADIGCGSGILAMACMQAARSMAVAVDSDPDSVLVASGNVRKNGLGPYVRVARGNGYTAPLVKEYGPFELILANIFADPLCAMAKSLKENLRPGGVAILSGLLTSQANKVLAAHKMQGLALIRRCILGEWSVLALTRPNGA